MVKLAGGVVSVVPYVENGASRWDRVHTPSCVVWVPHVQLGGGGGFFSMVQMRVLGMHVEFNYIPAAMMHVLVGVVAYDTCSSRTCRLARTSWLMILSARTGRITR